MARPWTELEKEQYRSELYDLYVLQNKTMAEVAKILGIKFQTVYDRLKRLGIATCPERKLNYQNRRSDIIIPMGYSPDLAEFFGIMLGDGSLSHFQTIVTLGTKELPYVQYVANLMERLFGVSAKIAIRKRGYRDIYIGSVELTNWLQSEGLVFNKVKAQVNVPVWIFSRKEYRERFLRGFFDTDGSVYKLRFGTQIAFINYSLPLLRSLQLMLKKLSYSPSAVSAHKIYLTKRPEVIRFFREIVPANEKHQKRFENFIQA
ncbi:MAG: LAGLIDADG family homing endonuclease [Patescibacteria group bacterium]